MCLPHLYYGLSRNPGCIADALAYNCRLIVWYSSIGITFLVADVLATDAECIPPLHHLLIHYISVWWNLKEKVFVNPSSHAASPIIVISALEDYSFLP